MGLFLQMKDSCGLFIQVLYGALCHKPLSKQESFIFMLREVTGSLEKDCTYEQNVI